MYVLPLFLVLQPYTWWMACDHRSESSRDQVWSLRGKKGSGGRLGKFYWTSCGLALSRGQCSRARGRGSCTCIWRDLWGSASRSGDMWAGLLVWAILCNGRWVLCQFTLNFLKNSSMLNFICAFAASASALASGVKMAACLSATGCFDDENMTLLAWRVLAEEELLDICPESSESPEVLRGIHLHVGVVMRWFHHLILLWCSRFCPCSGSSMSCK